MTNIAYFIGAGASCECLPLMESMRFRLGLFGEHVKTMVNLSNIGYVDTKKNSDILRFSKDIESLMSTLNEHITIDDYAKKLSDSGDSIDKSELFNLKILLSVYLLFEQLKKPESFQIRAHIQDMNDRKAINDSIRINIDKRYSPFYGIYFGSPAKALPDNVKIVSWNYDMQFELALASRFKHTVVKSMESLQSYPFIGEKIDLNKSCLIKLNGTCGLFSEENNETLISPIDPLIHNYRNAIEGLIDVYIRNKNRVFTPPIFYFAWENEPIVKKTRDLAMKILSTSDILVIIGYSFPTLNRKIDIQLFKNSNIKKIYLQVPIEN